MDIQLTKLPIESDLEKKDFFNVIKIYDKSLKKMLDQRPENHK